MYPAYETQNPHDLNFAASFQWVALMQSKMLAQMILVEETTELSALMAAACVFMWT